eukprot:1417463-Alexandrium_andersonii.AAC.1
MEVRLARGDVVLENRALTRQQGAVVSAELVPYQRLDSWLADHRAGGASPGQATPRGEPEVDDQAAGLRRGVGRSSEWL